VGAADAQGRSARAAQPAPALTHEDRIEAEMRKITEELQKRRG
jgi:hypothetical protein